jgi:hypothetical protein
VEAAERAGVEQIANTNRIVPAVVGEACDKRVTFADAVAAHFDPVTVVCRPACGVDGRSRSRTANPSYSSTVACALA